jgi:hypothetical protein
MSVKLNKVYVFTTHLVSAEFFSLETMKPFFERRAVLNNDDKFCDILRTVAFRNGKLRTLFSHRNNMLMFLFMPRKTTLLFT